MRFLSKGIITTTLGCLFLIPAISCAHSDSLSISVTPTVIEMTANPSQIWNSTLRIRNINSYDISVHIDVVNFIPQQKSGEAQFVPIQSEVSNGQTLAEWIKVSEKELVVPAEQSVSVPFQIEVPERIQPGGHYAAVLVGTKTRGEGMLSSQIETSQVVTSLVSLTVTGDILESGKITAFSASNVLIDKPDMWFNLTFQNDGNVHVSPVGKIVIYNLWNKECGNVPIDVSAGSSNIFPKQVREFEVHWQDDWSPLRFGRYTAVAAVEFGGEKNVAQSERVVFWYIPWKSLLVFLLVILTLVLFVRNFVKKYIEKILTTTTSGYVHKRKTRKNTSNNKKISISSDD